MAQPERREALRAALQEALTLAKLRHPVRPSRASRAALQLPLPSPRNHGKSAAVWRDSDRSRRGCAAAQGVVTLYDVVLERKRACLLLELCGGGTLLTLVQGRVNESKARIAREKRLGSGSVASPSALGASAAGLVVNLFGGGAREAPPYCLSEPEARAGLRAAAEALRYVHDRGFVHRDVKLENLLLSSPLDLGSLKLADFGFATQAVRPGGNGGPRAPDKGLQGTVEYAAPEILAAYRGRGKNSTAAADAEAAVRHCVMRRATQTRASAHRADVAECARRRVRRSTCGRSGSRCSSCSGCALGFFVIRTRI